MKKLTLYRDSILLDSGELEEDQKFIHKLFAKAAELGIKANKNGNELLFFGSEEQLLELGFFIHEERDSFFSFSKSEFIDDLEDEDVSLAREQPDDMFAIFPKEEDKKVVEQMLQQAKKMSIKIQKKPHGFESSIEFSGDKERLNDLHQYYRTVRAKKMKRGTNMIKESKYTRESKDLRDKIISFAKKLGFKINSSERQARAYQIWMKGSKDLNEKMRAFLAANKVSHADETGYDDAGHDEFVSDIETSFQNDPFQGNMLLITHWYASPTTKLDRGIDSTVSDKDYFGEIRSVIRDIMISETQKGNI